jgi:hypothetical protein
MQGRPLGFEPMDEQGFVATEPLLERLIGRIAEFLDVAGLHHGLAWRDVPSTWRR